MSTKNVGESVKALKEKSKALKEKSTENVTKSVKALAEKTGQAANFLTKTRAFKSLTKKAFKTCDYDNAGSIKKAELYSGLLLVHVKLAMYAGPAACFPPSREEVNKLFDISDVDKSGTIDAQEFEDIMVVCCAQMFSRVLAYYSVIIMLVPFMAHRLTYIIIAILDVLDDKVMPDLWAYIERQIDSLPSLIQAFLDFDNILQILVRSTLSFAAIPYLFTKIDESAQKGAREKAVIARGIMENKSLSEDKKNE